MTERRMIGGIAAGLSIACLLIPCLMVKFMPFHDDEFGVNRWDYFDSHMSTLLLTFTVIGIVAACFAAITRGKRWWVLAIFAIVVFVGLFVGRHGF